MRFLRRCWGFAVPLMLLIVAAPILYLSNVRVSLIVIIVDGGTINSIDSTGAAMLEALSEDLRARGIRLGFANIRTEVRTLLERSGVQAALGDGALFPTLKSAVDACVSGGFTETLEAGPEPS